MNENLNHCKKWFGIDTGANCGSNELFIMF